MSILLIVSVPFSSKDWAAEFKENTNKRIIELKNFIGLKLATKIRKRFLD
tara:strand:+ start:2406 stop:2555 length:150 start_codon:yes stop_codon:yes gene_type:complete